MCKGPEHEEIESLWNPRPVQLGHGEVGKGHQTLVEMWLGRHLWNILGQVCEAGLPSKRCLEIVEYWTYRVVQKTET